MYSTPFFFVFLDTFNGSDKERKTQLALPKTLSFNAISIESEFFQTVFGLKSQIQIVFNYENKVEWLFNNFCFYFNTIWMLKPIPSIFLFVTGF